MKLRTVLLAACLFLMPCHEAAADPARSWFVSLSGSDENPGTAAKPLRTIQRAAEMAGPGDTVRVAAGIYQEAVAFPRSGEEDAPIVFEGERGPEGQWLTVLDRSVPAAGWEPAPEVGEGVFKAALGFNPGCLTRDGRMLARIHDRRMALGRDDRRGGFNLLSMPAGEPLKGSDRVPADLLEYPDQIAEEHGFWDGLEALYGYFEGITYIRFRDGDDPRGLVLPAAPEGAGFVLRDRGHLVIRNFLVRGAQVCVEISGPQAVGNIIENNRLTHGRMRVLIARNAARNIVRGNEMTLAYYGHDRPGAWGTASPTIETSLALYVYRVFKNVIGPGSSDDNAVSINAAGEGNEVTGNRIYGGLIGISAGRSTGLRVSGNVISHMSSIGIASIVHQGQGALDAEFHDNLVYDCNINLRLHVYDLARPGTRREYYYRNIFHQSRDAGGNIYVHWSSPEPMPGTSGHPEFFFYHNTFSGGRYGLMAVSRFLTDAGGMDGTRFLNNIISARTTWSLGADFCAERDRLDVFDHNWVGGQLHRGIVPAWLGENNVLATGRLMWEGESMPDFRLPVESDARNAGLDLSKPFTVQGREFPALPGMVPGYFTGEAPDIGAVQSGAPLPVLLPAD